MNAEAFLRLVQNVALLLGLALLFELNVTPWRTTPTRLRQALLGLATGGIGILLMLTPWNFTPGIFFDTRSVLLGVSGLFFGGVPTLVAMAITAAFRIHQGGAATLMGVCVILATGSMGILWRHYRRHALAAISWGELYGFGLLLHVVMLALAFILPVKTALQVLGNISLPVMVIYPLGTMLLGKLLANRLRREQVAERLRESESWLRLAVGASNIGFYDLDLLTSREHFSPEWKRQLGYAEDEIRDDINEWRTRLHPDDLQPALDREAAAIEAHLPVYESEFRLRHKDGSYRWILSRGVLQYDEQGRAVRLLGCHIDVTDLKQAEQALRQSEANYRQLFNQASDAIFIADIQGNYVDVNSRGCEMLGYTRDEILQLSMTDLVDPVEAPQNPIRFDELRSGGNVVNQRRMIHKSGERIDVEISGRMLPDGRLLGIVRDVTERKRAEAIVQATQVELQRLLEEAAQSRKALLSLVEDQKMAEERIRQFNTELEQRVHERTAQLEAANKELEAFAYSVSHDLRTPLRALDGYSSLLLQEHAARLDEEGRSHLERIRSSTQRMGHLIDDLLKLSRVTRTEMKRVEVDLGSLAQEIRAELSASQPQRVVEWVLPEMLVVNADPALMSIVLQNLLGNAFKFTSRHASGRIQLGSLEQGSEKVYFVRDDGAGFDMAYAGKLFGAFERLHSDHEFEGSGIGLALVQRIIHRHGGRIWAEGAVEQGTSVYFTLGSQGD